MAPKLQAVVVSPVIVRTAKKSLPQSAAGSLFTISGGKVRILSIVGEVTTIIQSQTNNTKLQFVGTNPVATTDLCATLDITAKAVGSLFSITGTLATAMKVTTNNLIVPADNLAGPGMILGPGVIKLNCGASNTGAIQWTINYENVDDGGSVAFN